MCLHFGNKLLEFVTLKWHLNVLLNPAADRRKTYEQKHQPFAIFLADDIFRTSIQFCLITNQQLGVH